MPNAFGSSGAFPSRPQHSFAPRESRRTAKAAASNGVAASGGNLGGVRGPEAEVQHGSNPGRGRPLSAHVHVRAFPPLYRDIPCQYLRLPRIHRGGTEPGILLQGDASPGTGASAGAGDRRAHGAGAFPRSLGLDRRRRIGPAGRLRALRPAAFARPRPEFFIEAWKPGEPSRVFVVTANGNHQGTTKRIGKIDRSAVKQLARASERAEHLHLAAWNTTPCLLRRGRPCHGSAYSPGKGRMVCFMNQKRHVRALTTMPQTDSRRVRGRSYALGYGEHWSH